MDEARRLGSLSDLWATDLGARLDFNFADSIISLSRRVGEVRMVYMACSTSGLARYCC